MLRFRLNREDELLRGGMCLAYKRRFLKCYRISIKCRENKLDWIEIHNGRDE